MAEGVRVVVYHDDMMVESVRRYIITMIVMEYGLLLATNSLPY